MASNLSVCSMAPELKEKLRKFRFQNSKTLTALLLKIKTAELQIVVEEEFDDITIEDLVDEIPHQQPRYIAISYPLSHDDGRVSYPLLLVYVSPQDCNPQQQMMYAGSKMSLVNEGMFTKVVEYRSLDEFTDEAVQAHLKKV